MNEAERHLPYSTKKKKKKKKSEYQTPVYCGVDNMTLKYDAEIELHPGCPLFCK